MSLDELDTAPFQRVDIDGAVRTHINSYVPARTSDLYLGDVVRRAGHPMRIGHVRGLEGDVVLVQWFKDGPIDRRHVTHLQRRIDQ